MSLGAVVLPPISVDLVIGAELAVVGAVVALLGSRIAARWPTATGYVALARTVALVVGIGLIANAVIGHTTPDTNLRNPVAGTVTSVTAGADLFKANCAACHGVDGRGGGPLAGTTPVRPADLRSGHLGSHTDGDLFYWVSTGLPGGMPAWAAKLSETDRWNLVNYLRSINGQGPPPRPATASPNAAPSASIVLVVPLATGGAAAWLLAGLRPRRRRSPRGSNR